MELPRIIQGGMGIGISGWKLASAVASAGQLGVVSGLCLEEIMVRRLQNGDPGGHIRRALSHFPIKEISTKIINTFFNDKGKDPKESYIQRPMQTLDMNEDHQDLLVAGGFTEIFLAKEGHKGLVGVNLLEKIQTDCLSILYGCMLAGVDYITMGAGIPKEIPSIIEKLRNNVLTTLKVSVTNALSTDNFKMIFDPARFQQDKPLKKPKFLAIIASNVLALALTKKAPVPVDGFIVEGPEAGGHNAPARETKELSSAGEPVYGKKDEVDIEKIKELGVPFWLAGGYGQRGKLKEALALGAEGIQVGTPFALCNESGLTEELKTAAFNSDKKVFTDPYASPTGFPFKVMQLKDTLSERALYEARPRVCNLGYLRERYRKDDGTVGYRCSAEPIKAYIAKGGLEEDAANSKCLCNALFADMGLPNAYKNGYLEQPLVTIGTSISDLDYLRPGISAKEIVEYLLED